MIIGQGYGPEQAELFGITRDQQWDTIKENYLLLRRLWHEEKVTWNPSGHGIRRVDRRRRRDLAKGRPAAASRGGWVGNFGPNRTALEEALQAQQATADPAKRGDVDVDVAVLRPVPLDRHAGAALVREWPGSDEQPAICQTVQEREMLGERLVREDRFLLAEGMDRAVQQREPPIARFL